MSANVQAIPTPVKWVAKGKWERRLDLDPIVGSVEVLDVTDGATGPIEDAFTPEKISSQAALGEATWDYTLVDASANPGGSDNLVTGRATVTTTDNGATLVRSGADPTETCTGSAALVGATWDLTYKRSSGGPNELCTGLAGLLGTQHN